MKKVLLFLFTFSLVAILHAATATVNGITWTYQVLNRKTEIYKGNYSLAISPFGKVFVVYTSEALKGTIILEDFVLSCYDETTGQTYEAQAVTVTKSQSLGVITFEWDMAKDGIQLDAATLRFHVDYFADL